VLDQYALPEADSAIALPTIRMIVFGGTLPAGYGIIEAQRVVF
jgi:hypothetical protein